MINQGITGDVSGTPSDQVPPANVLLFPTNPSVLVLTSNIYVGDSVSFEITFDNTNTQPIDANLTIINVKYTSSEEGSGSALSPNLTLAGNKSILRFDIESIIKHAYSVTVTFELNGHQNGVSVTDVLTPDQVFAFPTGVSMPEKTVLDDDTGTPTWIIKQEEQGTLEFTLVGGDVLVAENIDMENVKITATNDHWTDYPEIIDLSPVFDPGIDVAGSYPATTQKITVTVLADRLWTTSNVSMVVSYTRTVGDDVQTGQSITEIPQDLIKPPQVRIRRYHHMAKHNTWNDSYSFNSTLSRGTWSPLSFIDNRLEDGPGQRKNIGAHNLRDAGGNNRVGSGTFAEYEAYYAASPFYKTCEYYDNAPGMGQGATTFLIRPGVNQPVTLVASPYWYRGDPITIHEMSYLNVPPAFFSYLNPYQNGHWYNCTAMNWNRHETGTNHWIWERYQMPLLTNGSTRGKESSTIIGRISHASVKRGIAWKSQLPYQVHSDIVVYDPDDTIQGELNKDGLGWKGEVNRQPDWEKKQTLVHQEDRIVLTDHTKYYYIHGMFKQHIYVDMTWPAAPPPYDYKRLTYAELKEWHNYTTEEQELIDTFATGGVNELKIWLDERGNEGFILVGPGVNFWFGGPTEFTYRSLFTVDSMVRPESEYAGVWSTGQIRIEYKHAWSPKFFSANPSYKASMPQSHYHSYNRPENSLINVRLRAFSDNTWTNPIFDEIFSEDISIFPGGQSKRPFHMSQRWPINIPFPTKWFQMGAVEYSDWRQGFQNRQYHLTDS